MQQFDDFQHRLSKCKSKPTIVQVPLRTTPTWTINQSQTLTHLGSDHSLYCIFIFIRITVCSDNYGVIYLMKHFTFYPGFLVCRGILGYIKFNKFRTDLISDQKSVRKLIRPKFFGVRNFCRPKFFRPKFFKNIFKRKSQYI